MRDSYREVIFQRSEAVDNLVYVNTDRELWREPEDRNGMSMANVFVTIDGGIGMNVGGSCVVMPIREWFKLANVPEPKPQE